MPGAIPGWGSGPFPGGASAAIGGRHCAHVDRIGRISRAAQQEAGGRGYCQGLHRVRGYILLFSRISFYSCVSKVLFLLGEPRRVCVCHSRTLFRTRAAAATRLTAVECATSAACGSGRLNRIGRPVRIVSGIFSMFQRLPLASLLGVSRFNCYGSLELFNIR